MSTFLTLFSHSFQETYARSPFKDLFCTAIVNPESLPSIQVNPELKYSELVADSDEDEDFSIITEEGEFFYSIFFHLSSFDFARFESLPLGIRKSLLSPVLQERRTCAKQTFPFERYWPNNDIQASTRAEPG